MLRWLQLALLLLMMATGGALSASQLIDGIVATVNSTPILRSDVEEATRYEALAEGRPPEALTGAADTAVLDRLVDQELLRQQMGSDFPAPADAELAERLQALREQLPGARSEAQWRQALARYHLSEAEVRERLRRQLQISRYIEQRLRPAIHVDSSSIQAYYRDKLLPQLKASGVIGEPALRLVRPRIEEILVQQRIGEELTGWLRKLRETSRIRLSADLTAAPGSGF